MRIGWRNLKCPRSLLRVVREQERVVSIEYGPGSKQRGHRTLDNGFGVLPVLTCDKGGKQIALFKGG